MTTLNPVYKRFSSDDDFTQLPPSSSRPRALTVILSFTTVIFALLSLYLSQTPPRICFSPNSSIFQFQDGYDTEWEPAKVAIDIERVTYTSVFSYNASSDTYYRDFDPTAPKYVGLPSPEIDQAWMDLLAGQYLVLSEEEALQLHDPVQVQGYYLGE